MVKKVLSIITVVLMMTAILNISVATHYCGGILASSKVSLSGKPATCGMENNDIQIPVTGTVFSSLCCENVIRHYCVAGNYFPSFTSIQVSFQQHLQTYEIPEFLFRNIFASQINPTSESPPVLTNNSKVDLSDICIFRI